MQYRNAIEVCILGFSPLEVGTLEAFFRTSRARAQRKDAQDAHCYVNTPDPQQAQILIVDGDSSEATKAALSHASRSIVVGSRGIEGQLGHLPRPINVLALLKLLDRYSDGDLQSAEALPTAVPSPRVAASPPPPFAATVPSPFAATVQPRAAAAPPPVVAAAPQGFPDAHGVSLALADNVLVVDDSDIALFSAMQALRRFGFTVHVARRAEEALRLVATIDFAYVFMDVNMPGVDGYQACKQIKKRGDYGPGRHPPFVVMLTSRDGMVDKIRGTLSGCDAYLTKPLQTDALAKVIGRRVVAEAAVAPPRFEPARAV